MKPLFGYNKTTNQPSYAHKFITKTISKKLEAEYDEIVQVSNNIHKKMENKLRKYSKYIIFFGISLLLVCCVFWFKDGFTKMWEERQMLLILGGISSIVGVVLVIVSLFIKPSKELLEDLEWNKKELAEWNKKLDEFFAFGDNTYKVDILCPQYSEKNGKVKLEVMFGLFNNIPTTMFIENDKLCVSDKLSLYEIPMENVTAVKFSKEPRPFYNWTQDEEYSKEYSEKVGNQIVKSGAGYKAMSCGRVYFNFEGEEYYFEFLPYDFYKINELFKDVLEKQEAETLETPLSEEEQIPQENNETNE